MTGGWRPQPERSKILVSRSGEAETRDQAGAILMATHCLGEIRSTCRRAIWIDEDAPRADGPANDVVNEYEPS